MQSHGFGTPDWAADFQSLQLNETRATPIPQPKFCQQAPIQHSVPGGWHQEFLRNQKQATPNHALQQRAVRERGIGGLNYDNFNAMDRTGTASAIAQHAQSDNSMRTDYDQDMERAFEAVDSEQAQAQEPTPPIDLAQGYVDIHPSTHFRIGSDIILDEALEREGRRTDRNDADELARTAGQLLDNLKHDQSQKFQNSSFLSLMRQLRDREIQVEGDRLVDVSTFHPSI